MFYQWLLIGVVIWYFYRRSSKRAQLGSRPEHRHIRDEDVRHGQNQQAPPPVDEDDYIDYEEIK